jgi:hypothetical protein
VPTSTCSPLKHETLCNAKLVAAIDSNKTKKPKKIASVFLL